MIWGAARRRARVDAAVAAYTQWRSERDGVRAAYRVWSAAGALGEPLAFETYQSALDREERAATTYASLMSRVGHLAKTGLAHQSAPMQALRKRARDAPTCAGCPRIQEHLPPRGGHVDGVTPSRPHREGCRAEEKDR